MYDLTIQPQDDILRVEIRGQRSPQGADRHALETWSRITKAASEAGLTKVLAITHISGPMSVWHAFNLGDNLQQPGWSRRNRLAFVMLDPSEEEKLRFAQLVASNRGFQVQVFHSEDEALKWLKS